jgi:hypothetical protein
VLDHSLSFITWALLSDHYVGTKFKCNFDEARSFMAVRLSGLQLGSNEPLRLDPTGKNTLYPLIQGFAVLAQTCKELLKEPEGAFRRPTNQLPDYYEETEISPFPFLHMLLLWDLRKDDSTRIIALLEEVTGVFESSDVSNVRNRIEHKRADFPDQSEIEKACHAVTSIMKKMEESGVCPMVYLYAGESVDEYRRKVVKLQDHKGTIIEIEQPSEFSPVGLPSVRQAQIVVPWMHIDDSFELMRFRVEETSDYTKILRTFPKRRSPVSVGSPQESDLAQGQELNESMTNGQGHPKDAREIRGVEDEGVAEALRRDTEIEADPAKAVSLHELDSQIKGRRG